MMKYTLVFALIFSLLSGFTHNKAIPYADEVYTGRLEIKGPCSQRVVSIISSNAGRARVENFWKDPLTKQVYEYIFTVKNFCDLGNLKEGETFSFRFTTPRIRNACPSCLMYRPVPDSDRFVTVLRKGGSMAPTEVVNKH